MLMFIYGIAAATAAFILSRLIENFLHKKFVEKILTPNEEVASYDATVIVTKDGEFSGWINNKREIQIK